MVYGIGPCFVKGYVHVSDFKVVRVAVAGQTLRKFLMNRRVVGCITMTALALWNFTMARMTEGAGEVMVFGFASL